MNGSNFEPSQYQLCMLARVIVFSEDVMSHLTIPPVACHEIPCNLAYMNSNRSKLAVDESQGLRSDSLQLCTSVAMLSPMNSGGHLRGYQSVLQLLPVQTYVKSF